MRLLSLGIGLVILGLAAAPMRLTAQAASGEAIFQQKCSACHLTGSDRLVGPGLAGVTTRRDRAWLKRFIMQPDQVLASGDSIANALLQEFQVPMPNIGTTDAEAEALIVFLGGAEASAPPAVIEQAT
jgi:protein SCO1/2